MNFLSILISGILLASCGKVRSYSFPGAELSFTATATPAASTIPNPGTSQSPTGKLLINGNPVIDEFVCQPYTVSLLDLNDTITPATEETEVFLKTDGRGHFFSNSLCSEKSNHVKFSIGDTSKTVYYAHQQADGSGLIQATGAHLTSGSLSVSPSLPSSSWYKIRLNSPLSSHTNVCVQGTIELQNTQGFAEKAPRNFNLAVTGSGTVMVDNSDTCSTATSTKNIILASGQSKVNFYFISTTDTLSDITINSGDLSSSTSIRVSIGSIFTNTAMLAGKVSRVGSRDGLDPLFDHPTDIVNDGTWLYVLDHVGTKIRRVNPNTGETMTVAGRTETGNSSLDGYGPDLDIGYVFSITSAGDMGIALSMNGCLRFLDTTTFVIRTAIGKCNVAGNIDGVGSDARIPFFLSMAYDATNRVLYGGASAGIYRIDTTSWYSELIAGDGITETTDDGIGLSARVDFSGGSMVLLDSTQLLFGNQNYLRRLDLETLTVSTLESATAQGSMVFDGTQIWSLNTGQREYILNRIFAGGAPPFPITYYGSVGGASRDGDLRSGPGMVTGVSGLTLMDTKLFFTENNSQTIRWFNTTTNEVRTLAGASDANSGISSNNRFEINEGATPDEYRTRYDTTVGSFGSVLVTYDSTICEMRRIDMTSGLSHKFAGNQNLDYNPTNCTPFDGSSSVARFSRDLSAVINVTIAGSNSLLIADGQLIRKLDLATGVVQTVAGTYDQNSNNETIIRDNTGTGAGIFHAIGLAKVGGRAYFADGHTLRAIDIATANPTYYVSTVAGAINQPGTVDDVGTNARFYQIQAIATDGTLIYIADWNTIRVFDPTTERVTTVAGDFAKTGHFDDRGLAAIFDGIIGFGYSSNINALYVWDSNYGIRTVDLTIQSYQVSTVLAHTLGQEVPGGETNIIANSLLGKGPEVDNAAVLVIENDIIYVPTGAGVMKIY